MRNISENDLIKYLKIILDLENQISLRDFIDRIPQAFGLSPHNLSSSSTRPNESMYEQLCRNIISHQRYFEFAKYINGVFYKK